ncbi:KPN_02809 family neutral zinc metallopeptidase [Christiangramia flava]|uniref:YpfJ protein, zinc metalloprotease superfamily n=1 Tax=Christiangramia flava JLT2011 TaxID=1229726 RepID=A0A1L7HZX2_9FLAO|nr:neutral zinc metallopeptidase [Christiangramia flava]APU66880.1 YpfJ protein, zinc metalloprotease superfamily [Christiangramia flava JLT2011]OSS37979.1 YpfJ protein, zinc metalloprotease superfamily [Christiangramia flava JLT2011]
MKWKGRRQSSNVEDRRGMSGRGKLVAGGGIIGLIFVIAQFVLSDGDVSVLEQLQDPGTSQTEQRELTAEEKELGDFTEVVLADTEDVWNEIFASQNMTYNEPGMVLFSDAVRTGCGNASAATGPFYCPADQKVYMDLTFFEELRTRFGAKGGDFAIAYVIAHEVGHHVQNVLGTASEVRRLQQQSSQTEANELSVAMELQADFYAGIWAHYNQEYLQEGDIEEALSAANAVGDDAIQRRVSGNVNPDSFTHGTSKQRMEWFMKGYRSGDMNQRDTFSALLH